MVSIIPSRLNSSHWIRPQSHLFTTFCDYTRNLCLYLVCVNQILLFYTQVYPQVNFCAIIGLLSDLLDDFMHSRDNDELKTYLASRIRFERNKKGYSQEKMASLAGVSTRTYKRFEQSCNGGFDNFINILRVFDRLETLEKVFPAPVSNSVRSMTAIIEDLNKQK